ncbi:MAG TPA: hypothetical protein VFB67_09125 [Candidatus Polarisedimenticolaceae bacterium]|nr:hypothetical protein [Candidatus Polarisedimenticolaceae bacterium]
MKTMTKALFAAGTTAVLFTGIISFTAVQAVPPDKRVTIACEPGWRGSAVGTYGGVGFGVSCQNGKGNTTLQGVTGEDYSIRVGVESSSIAADCLFQGSSPTVDETCVVVRLTIR